MLCLKLIGGYFFFFFFFNDTATTEIYTLSLHDALPISTAPAFFGSTSGNMNTSKSGPGLRLENVFVIEPVRKLDWWCRKALGGFWKSGAAASLKFVERTAALPPKVIFGSLTIPPQVCHAFLI